ncbi:MAG: ATP-binding SpoIIE family protein phosphatase [Rhizobacter sp.]
MTPYLNIAVTEPSQVGEARRAAVRLANEMGFDEVASGRVALVVTELGTNLARHAEKGRLMLGMRQLGGAPAFEIISVDHGPGMADVERCLRDGYSTGGTPGSGLGAVQRLSNGFSVFSSVGRGTAIVARVSPDHEPGVMPKAPTHQTVAVAGICLAAPGETVSGDGWHFLEGDEVASAIVADGLGHGPSAAEASDAAIRIFGCTPGTPSRVLELAHRGMRDTRGAAVAIASLDVKGDAIKFAGVGNIAGRLISGISDRSLLSQHGTVGMQIRHLNDMSYPWPTHSLLIMHSDGIATRWNLADVGGLLQSDPAVIAAWLIRDHIRGKDDATVVVVRRV